MVQAVAGSGKSTLCEHTVLKWLSQGAHPDQTAVITFTRRAAESIRGKIERHSKARLGFVGTFHGLVYQALTLACDGRHRVTPLTNEHMEAVVHHVARVTRTERLVNSRVIKYFKDKRSVVPKGEDFIMIGQVESYCRQMRMAHIGRLPVIFNKAVAKDPEFRSWVESRCRNMVVDEAQDMNDDDRSIVETVNPQRLFMVGDHRQSIYGFRGAEPGIMVGWPGEHASIRYNFRSGTHITDAANGLWRGTPELPLVPFRRDEGEVRVVHCGESCHTWHCAAAVMQEVEMGRKMHVLCRQNFQVAMMHKRLTDMGVASTIISPAFDKYASEEWKALFLAACWALSPECEWLRSEVQARTGLTLSSLSGIEWSQRCIGDLAALVSMWFTSVFAGDDTMGMQLPEFVSWYQSRDLQDLVSESTANAVIMTVHASKGLEFDSVALLDVGKTLGGQRKYADETAEEKNLLHVGMTRARDLLVLTGGDVELSTTLGLF